MYAISTVDGFMAVNEDVEEMLKYVANEPSMGLYFVQQHAHNAIPNLLKIKDRVVGRARETVLHTEDSEDSIQAIRSMAECGVPIVDDMIKDINKALHLMSISTPQRGLIQGSRFSRSSSQPVLASSHSMESRQSDPGSGQGYLKSVFNSARRKASVLGWSALDTTSLPYDSQVVAVTPTVPQPAVLETSVPNTSGNHPPESDAEKHHGHIEQKDGATTSSIDDLLVNYEQFQAEREANLKKWLEEIEEHAYSTK